MSFSDWISSLFVSKEGKENNDHESSIISNTSNDTEYEISNQASNNELEIANDSEKVIILETKESLRSTEAVIDSDIRKNEEHV